MFWCSLVGADRPPKRAMLVAIACLEKKDLGLCVPWSLSLLPPILSVPRCKKVALYVSKRKS